MNNLSDRQGVWMALSDLFIDNEISYDYIAQRVAHLSVSEIKQILFCEVAPVCMSNLLVLTPTNAKGFSEEYIIPKVQQHLQKMHDSWLYRKRVTAKIKFYKFCLRQDWQKLVAKIRYRQNQIVNDL